MRNECRDVPKDRELENYCRIVANERTVIPENISYVLEYVTTIIRDSIVQRRVQFKDCSTSTKNRPQPYYRHRSVVSPVSCRAPWFDAREIRTNSPPFCDAVLLLRY